MYIPYKSETKTVYEVIQGIIPNGWSINDSAFITFSKSIEMESATAFEVLLACASTYKITFLFDNKRRVITLVDPTKSRSLGVYFTDQLNLTELSFKGDTANFATRLYARGKDGLTFASINGGKDYVDNNEYATKIVSECWIDERYTVAESLLDDTKMKLAHSSFPIRSYTCTAVDLARISAQYNFLDVKIHGIVTFIDRRRNTRIPHQVVEYKRYPKKPNQNVITLSNATAKIESTVKNIDDKIKDVVVVQNNKTEQILADIKKTIDETTSNILGVNGGFFGMLLNDVTKKPYGFVIMDNENAAIAKNIWLHNQYGMAHSSVGIAGPYTAAWTQEGVFYADFIKAGKMSGVRIEAGTIEASALSVDYRNSVTNAITDGIKTFETVTLEQIFKAADGTFRSEIKKEVTSGVTPAINAARDAKSAADAAQSSANAGLDNISDIISDSKLTPNEKTLASKEWATITAEHGDLQKQQKAFNISCNYESTYTELETYLTPLWANMSGTSEIVAATYKQKFVNYYTARQNLLNKIAEITKSTADTANNTANTAAANYTNISQNAEIIKLMSGEKLGRDELRTETSLIINPTAVQIAWNNIAQNIKFEGNWLNGGQMNIYDSVTSQKLITFDPRGMSFFRDNDFLGLIGSSEVRLQDNSVRKGLDIDLDSDGAYIAFAARDSANTSTFTIKWAYAHQDIGNLSAGKLHAGCDIDMHGHKLLNPTFEGGGISGTTNFIKIVDMDEYGNITKYSLGCSMQFVNGILVSATF